MIRQLTVKETASVTKQLVTKQGNKCAICSTRFTPRDGAVLDHDHSTGFIRGAVHRSCNGAEGRVKTKAYLGHKGVSSADYIIGLGKYLELHQKPQYPLIYHSHLTENQKRLARNAKARKARAAKKK